MTCLAVDGPFLADTRSLSTAAHSPKRHYPDTRSMRWAPTAPWTAQRAECRWPTRLRSTRACERPPWLAAGRHSRSCRQRAAGLARGGRRTRKRETREHPGCDPSSVLGPDRPSGRTRVGHDGAAADSSTFEGAHHDAVLNAVDDALRQNGLTVGPTTSGVSPSSGFVPNRICSWISSKRSWQGRVGGASPLVWLKVREAGVTLLQPLTPSRLAPAVWLRLREAGVIIVQTLAGADRCRST